MNTKRLHNIKGSVITTRASVELEEEIQAELQNPPPELSIPALLQQSKPNPVDEEDEPTEAATDVEITANAENDKV